MLIISDSVGALGCERLQSIYIGITKCIFPGDLTYTAKAPAELSLVPLMRQKAYTGEQLFRQLVAEAEALRKEKKRNVYSGIHKLVLLFWSSSTASRRLKV